MVKGKVLRYFAGGNTAHGFHDLFSSTLEGLNRLFILKGGPGTGKSTLMRDLADSCIERGYDVELVHCASDPDSLDGVIIPAIKCGIVDGTAPHIVEPELPGVVEEYVNLGSCWDSLVLQKNREEIIHLTQEIKTCFKKAYEAFSEALSIHDEWEKIYIDNMDFEKANEFTDQLISLLLGGEEGKGTATI
ncbi:MAG TPA: hypothetical protein VEY51_19150, partial [Chondromyces sp.]|nr:hypothetical protein [Chondromyces sp.]